MDIILILVYISVLLSVADIAYRKGYHNGFRDGVQTAKRAFNEVYKRKKNDDSV